MIPADGMRQVTRTGHGSDHIQRLVTASAGVSAYGVVVMVEPGGRRDCLRRGGWWFEGAGLLDLMRALQAI
jgi:hypothetical protein